MNLVDRIKKYDKLNRRLGRFSLSFELVEKNPELVMKMFSEMEMIVLEAVSHYWNGTIEYVAQSPKFPIVPEECQANQFLFGCRNNGEIYFERLKL